jgi:hypothetical protein
MTLFEGILSEITALSISEIPKENFPSVVSDTAEVRVFTNAQGDWLYCLKQSDPSAALLVSGDYRRMAKLPINGVEKEGENFRFLLRTAFECRFCHQGIISLHAACVDLDGYAVAFTGHSGMGKSTRAVAWEEAFGASLISGDRPAVRLEKDGSTACGVPWDGKEQIYRDVEMPLKCILDVRRSPENYIRRLTPAQARRVITRQCFVPMWDTDAAALALANVRRLVRLTPVYRVFCGPTAQDAREIRDILIHHPEKIREEKDEMKIKNGFVLRNVVDEYMVMPTGDNIAAFGGAMVLNEASAFIFKQLQNEVSRDDLLSAMLAEYDVDEQTAAKDLDALLARFAELGILEA